MNRNLVYIIVGLVLIGLLLVVFFPLVGFKFAITGYDGPVGGFTGEIEWPDKDIVDPSLIIEEVNPTFAMIYPNVADIFDVFIPCGLRAELQAVPNVITQEVIDTVYKSVVDETAGTNTTTTVEIVKAKCNFGVTISTYSGGLDEIEDVTFWIELQDNADSIFSSAEDRYAYFVEFYTRSLAVGQGYMTVVPSAQGANFVPVSIEKEDVPQWLLDAGYTTSASQFVHVKIPLRVLSAVPFLSGLVREESYVTWDIGFDVILTGMWEHVADLKDWDWPEIPDFWGLLLDAIGQFLWYIAGIVLSIVVIAKVRDPRFIAVLLGIIWLLVLWQVGVFDLILE